MIYHIDAVPVFSTAVYTPVLAPPAPQRTARAKSDSSFDSRLVAGGVTGVEITSDPIPPATRRRFDRLARKWKSETLFTSAIDDMAMNSNYQQIIGMGPVVVPLILGRLKERPDFWFWALTAITGTNPIPARDLGNIKKMRDAWLGWGRQRGYSV